MGALPICPWIGGVICTRLPPMFYRAKGYAIFRSVLPQAILDTLGEVIRTEVHEVEGPLVRHYGEPAPHKRAADGRNAIGHPHLAPLARLRQASLDVFLPSCCSGGGRVIRNALVESQS
jgi:hypothetical protein